MYRAGKSRTFGAHLDANNHAHVCHFDIFPPPYCSTRFPPITGIFHCSLLPAQPSKGDLLFCWSYKAVWHIYPSCTQPHTLIRRTWHIHDDLQPLSQSASVTQKLSRFTYQRIATSVASSCAASNIRPMVHSLMLTWVPTT